LVQNKTHFNVCQNHGKTYQQTFDELKEEMIQAATEYPEIKRQQSKDPHLLVGC